jgi:UDPglucose 6-dehydrogenase
MLAEICAGVPGGDVDVVTRALGADSRIGPKYLKGGLGYGGPCFPRDNVALSFLARAVGSAAELAETTDRFNRALAGRIAARIRARLRPNQTVALLGLAYKPHSHVVEESQGICLARALSEAGIRVVAYDPLANQTARTELADAAMVLDSAAACLTQADAVVIATPDPEFARLPADSFKRAEAPMVVYDLWRALEPVLSACPHVEYVPYGRGAADEAAVQVLRMLWAVA